MAAQKPPDDIFLQIGSTGLKEHGGFVNEEWLPRLGGRRGVLIYREMSDNDAVIGAILYAIESFIRQVDWRAKPAKEGDERSMQAAQFLEECIVDMSVTWEDFIAEVLTFLPFGWSYFEQVMKRRLGMDPGEDSEGNPLPKSKFDDGRIGWRKFGVRAQETLWRWEFDQDGAILGMVQQDIYKAQTGPVFIPIEKSLLFRTKANKNNPEGRSILRNAFRSWWFLKRIQEIEAIGIERDLAGLPVMEVPIEIMRKSATADQKTLRSHFELLVQQIRRDEREGVVVPSATDVNGNSSGYKLSLLSSAGARQIDSNKIIERYEKRIATTVLHDWVLLGQDKVGSLALASSKTQASALAVEATLDQIASVLNRVAIPRLYALNPEFPPESWATLEHGDIEVPDLTEVAAYIFQGIGSGVLTPDKGLERHYRKVGSLPDQDEDKDLEPLEPRPEPTQKAKKRKKK